MENRISRTKRLTIQWQEFEDRINQMEDDFVEEAIQDMQQMAKSMGRKYDPYKAVDSCSVSERFAMLDEADQLYGRE